MLEYWFQCKGATRTFPRLFRNEHAPGSIEEWWIMNITPRFIQSAFPPIFIEYGIVSADLLYIIFLRRLWWCGGPAVQFLCCARDRFPFFFGSDMTQGHRRVFRSTAWQCALVALIVCGAFQSAMNGSTSLSLRPYQKLGLAGTFSRNIQEPPKDLEIFGSYGSKKHKGIQRPKHGPTSIQAPLKCTLEYMWKHLQYLIY